MKSCRKLTFTVSPLAGLAAFAAATPAAAGRCGHSYPVDQPTTLSEVARQCNVRLTELREANPGIDPAYVRPGEHLAVPDEISPYSTAGPCLAQTSATASAVSTHPYIVSPDYAGTAQGDAGFGEIIPVQDYRGDGGRAAQRVRVRDAQRAADAPLWLQRDPPTDGHYAETDRMSYQKLSALRIRNAGFRFASASIPSADGVPPARFTDKPAIIVTTTHPGYRAPDYRLIGKFPHQDIKSGASIFSLSGDVIDAYQGCLLLRTTDDKLWRLAAAPPSDALIGKTVTVWGARALGGACGDGPALAVSHAVYAEPWTDH